MEYDGEEKESIKFCSFVWADNFWIMSHSKKNLEQMLKDLIEEAAEMDLEPKPASLWWSNTYASGEKEDMILGTSKGCYKFPFEHEFRILVNRQGKTCGAVEERMQSANKAFWKDIKIYKTKDVPWRINHVYAVFSFGSETWSWTHHPFEKVQRWETKIMTKLFSLKRQKEETWVDYQTRKALWKGRYGSDEIALSVRKNCGKYVSCRRVGMQ